MDLKILSKKVETPCKEVNYEIDFEYVGSIYHLEINDYWDGCDYILRDENGKKIPQDSELLKHIKYPDSNIWGDVEVGEEIDFYDLLKM